MADPIRQLLSQTSYDTDGSTTVWNFSFSDGYLDKSHVKVQTLDTTTGLITQVPITIANFIGPYQLSLTPALPAGSELTIYRDTPKDMPIVNFADKAQITELSLDTNARQAIMVAAEVSDTVGTSLDAVSEVANQVQNAVDAADAAAASSATATGAASAAGTSASSASADAAAVAAAAAVIAGGPVASYNGRFGVVVPLPADRTALGAAKSGANSDITSLTALSTPLSQAQGGTGVTSGAFFGRLLNVRVLTGSGTYTPTAGTTAVLAFLQGAGGGGGGSTVTAAGQLSAGGGGGAGALSIHYATSGFAGAAYSAGTGGIGVNGAAGAAGGASTFLGVTAPGGGGGTVVAATPSASIGGQGGAGLAAGTGANIVNGAPAQGGNAIIFAGAAAFISGQGASSQFGAGGEARVGNLGGSAARGKGAGGGGGCSLASSPVEPGGGGTDGIIIVYEFS